MKHHMSAILIWLSRVFMALSCAVLCATTIYALGQPSYVEFSATPGSLQLVNNGIAAPILLDSQDYAGVIRAAHDLQTDLNRVTQVQPALLNDGALPQSADVLIVGTLGKNRRIDELVGAGKLDVSAIRGRWESFIIQVVPQAFPGAK